MGAEGTSSMTFSRQRRLITFVYLSKLEPKTEEAAGESTLGPRFCFGRLRVPTAVSAAGTLRG